MNTFRDLPTRPPIAARPSPDHPLVFQPLPRERVWGGSRLRELFGKDFPVDRPIGESWEVADRPDAVSVVAEGPLTGTTLRELMAVFPEEMVGHVVRSDGRFPWLAKLLDAREDLSLQVHPPAHLAGVLGGEPKTELWYVAFARPGARLLAGLRSGTSRAEFIERSTEGSVTRCFNELPVQSGDVLFVPSGRVHALGGGIVIFELQQNSDTTYRVFDFNRLGLDGKPRPLHLAEAFQAIDFSDFSPTLVPGRVEGCRPGLERPLVNDPAFAVTEIHAAPGDQILDRRQRGEPGLLAVVQGALQIEGGGVAIRLLPGGFALLPAALHVARIEAVENTILLQMTPGRA